MTYQSCIKGKNWENKNLPEWIFNDEVAHHDRVEDKNIFECQSGNILTFKDEDLWWTYNIKDYRTVVFAIKNEEVIKIHL